MIRALRHSCTVLGLLSWLVCQAHAQQWSSLKEDQAPLILGSQTTKVALEGDTFVLGYRDEARVSRRQLVGASAGAPTSGKSFDWDLQIEATLVPSTVAGGASYQFADLLLHGDTLAMVGATEIAVFRREVSGNWIEETILPTSGAVDLHGELIAVGQSGFGLVPGEVHVFERSGSTWTPMATLTPPAGVFAFGASVAIDGTTLVVGAPGLTDGPFSTSTEGATAVFELQGGVWSAPVWLTPLELEAGPDKFGTDVDLCGGYLAVGAPDNGSTGAVHVYELDAGVWQEEAVFVGPNPAFLAQTYGTRLELGEDRLAVLEPGAVTHWYAPGTSGWQLISAGFNNSQVLDHHVAIDGSRIAFGFTYQGFSPRNDWSIYQIAPNPWVNLGGGTWDIGQAPYLDVHAPLTPGSTMAVQLTSRADSQPMLELLSFASAPFPAIGGVLHAWPIHAQFPATIGSEGGWQDWILWPKGIPSGIGITMQILVKEPASVHGLQMSNAVFATTP